MEPCGSTSYLSLGIANVELTYGPAKKNMAYFSTTFHEYKLSFPPLIHTYYNKLYTSNEQIHSYLRRLAKRSDYQTVFGFSKESPIWVFRNRDDFTNLQLVFLTYLSFYHSIELDVHLGEIDARVLENEIYEDAYCYYRNHERKKGRSSLPTMTDKSQSQSTFQWLFKSRRKK